MFMFVPLGALLLYQKLSADDRLLPMQAIARRMPLGVPCRITLKISGGEMFIGTLSLSLLPPTASCCYAACESKTMGGKLLQ